MTLRDGKRVTFSEYDEEIILNNDNINQSRFNNEEDIENSEENSNDDKISFFNSFNRFLTTSPSFNYICKLPFTYVNVLWIITHIMVICLAYGALLFLLGAPMMPGGNLFGFYWLIISSYTLGWSLAYIPYINLPPVFGMLLAGIIIRISGLYNVQEEIGHYITSKIRAVCLTFITIRAGLQLSTTSLVRHPIFLLELALIPCTIEFFVIALYSKLILGYPWDWAFLSGTIMASMSPIITVNCILNLAEKGYGEDRDMATLFTTAASIDGVHMVALFGLCYSFVFSNNIDSIIWWIYIPGGVRDLFFGSIVGFIIGLILAFLPHYSTPHIEIYRTVCLILGSLFCILGPSKITITGGGYLASIFMSFIASTGWKMLSESPLTVMPLRRIIHLLWHISQPIFVGLIGAEVDFSHWSSERCILHIICIFIGLMTRSFFVILTTIKTPFSVRERIFIALSWLPKGTLQAAFAPMTLEGAQQYKDSNGISLAMDIVQMSVLAVVFLAPVGAIIMTVTGPILLNKIDDVERDRRRRLSFLRLCSLQPIHKVDQNQQDEQYNQDQSVNTDL
ncbi:hypothetical protein PV327_005374 [Microctonus hyperodae]|uniref:Uncharacterized protein n=1 Tax=Microctonus hyperodae TaxID=165561 RepID=A0AA39KZR6_MICHY|nr:hypothetical protein PV327_005374 [Microctonus hyperodae]